MNARISTILTFAALIGFGCEASDDFEPNDPLEVNAIESVDIDAIAAPEQAAEFEPDPELLDAYGWTEAPLDPAEIYEIGEITVPPQKGLCGGYWEYSGYADFQGCGTCVHTVPDPDRDGNLAYWYKRWCWTGWGCGGCDPWITTGTQCYDNC